MQRAAHFLVSSLLGSIFAFFTVAFLSNFHTSRLSFYLLSFFLSAAGQLAGFYLVKELFDIVVLKWRTGFMGLIILFLGGALALVSIRLCLKFPSLFDRNLLFMKPASVPVFVGFSLASGISVGALLWVLSRRGSLYQVRTTRMYIWLRRHLAGLILASLFFVVYFTLAETINFPGFRTLDQYFDTDISAWLARMQAASPLAVMDEVRAVHPAVLLFLRPLVWIVSLPLNGDRLHAFFIVHALAASLCVFLTWLIVLRVSRNNAYALAGAFLLGVSASHILLGSMLETYIYSALALLSFVLLLQNGPVNLKLAVLAGVVVFGITVTNLVQTIILYFVNQPRLKVIFFYIMLVVGIVLLLNLAQVSIFPAAKILSPSNLLGEQRYQIDVAESSRHTLGRISLMARAIPLYGILAPTPFVLMEELGVNVPNFRTFKITIGEFHVAGYSGLADLVVKAWIVILVLAVFFFVRDWFRKPRPLISLGLLICLGFNFILHMFYGDDPMLYSPDWVYALVLFVVFSFARFADRKWIQVPFIAFLALAVTINLGLIRQIMEVSMPFYGH